ncbi:MAG TPA: response regulator [Solirubrobacteraceae bacterium]|nr:response regulator [Solirubrobacteraceae bacterium]
MTAAGDVLLVEDADVHVEFTRLAFESEGIADRLAVARDGEEAMAMIDDRADRPPRLVLLDLKLPGMSGFDVLQAIRSHASEQVRRTPVVILTTSRAPADVRRAYDLNANSYLRKPLELPEFIDLIGAVRAWWLERVELP